MREKVLSFGVENDVGASTYIFNTVPTIARGSGNDLEEPDVPLNVAISIL